MTMLSPEADPEALAPRDELRIGVPPHLTGKPLVVIFGAALVATLLLAPFVGAGAFLAIAAAFLVAFAATGVPATLVLGYDGLAVVWLGRRLFVPYDALEGESRTVEGVELRVRGGRTLELRTRRPDEVLGRVAWRKNATLSVVALGAEADLAPDVSLLGPTGDTRDWTRRLESLAHGDYRAASLPRDRLLAIVACPRLGPEIRAAAAVVLGPPRDDHEANVLSRALASTASKLFERALWYATSEARSEREPALLRVLAAARREARDQARP
jgi:hypothetical protein